MRSSGRGPRCLSTCKQLCWLHVISGRLTRPSRTLYHVSHSLPFPQKESRIEMHAPAHLQKRNRRLCNILLPTSSVLVILERCINNLTRTDGHRTIGRTWHASRLKSSSQAEAISWSTRNVPPLPHPEMIRSSLPLTIRGFCLCLTTIKPSLILAGRSRPRHGEPYSSVLNKENH